MQSMPAADWALPNPAVFPQTSHYLGSLPPVALAALLHAENAHCPTLLSFPIHHITLAACLLALAALSSSSQAVLSSCSAVQAFMWAITASSPASLTCCLVSVHL